MTMYIATGIFTFVLMGMIEPYPISKSGSKIDKFGQSAGWFMLHLFLSIVWPVGLAFVANYAINKLNKKP